MDWWIVSALGVGLLLGIFVGRGTKMTYSSTWDQRYQVRCEGRCAKPSAEDPTHD